MSWTTRFRTLCRHVLLRLLPGPPRTERSFRIKGNFELHERGDVYDLFSDLLLDLGSVLGTLVMKPGPVLDIGGGTGRLAFRLARAGIPVTLVDISPSMLARAQQRRLALPVQAQGAMQIVEADFRHLALGTKFSYVVGLGASLCSVQNRSELESVLERIREHMNEDALVILEVASHEFLSNQSTAWHPGLHTERNGSHFCTWYRILPGPSDQEIVFSVAVCRGFFHFEYLTTRSLIFPRPRWEEMFQKAGLTVKQVKENWLGEPLAFQSQTTIYYLGKK